jgi:sialate O-acetylesterase
MADPAETVMVEFRGNHASTKADTLGRWSVYLPPGAAGGPFVLTIRGKNTITWNDVLVGDVWIASGQSNMEYPMDPSSWNGTKRPQKEIAAANYPNLRLFHVENAFADYPMTDVAAKTWTACTPQSVAGFSAVAYFFARELVEKEKVPIGVVETEWDGTPAEAWTSLGALSADASLMPIFAARAHMMEDETTTLLEQKAEKQAADAARAKGKKPEAVPWHPDPNAWAPSALFNAMIAPLVPLPIRGVIWYQGESNTDAERAPMYARLFQTMIRDWRVHWAQGDFPFLFVQIANFDTTDDWPTVREAQRKALVLANTGMAVTIDIGNPTGIHPADKEDVGHRLALWARAISYGEHVEDSGPLFRQAVPENGGMRVWFNHAASGLVVKGGQLTGFEVAGMDGKFVSAQARVNGNSIIVSSASVPKPHYVRYGWAANPACNLYNGDGLPASPFSSVQ